MNVAAVVVEELDYEGHLRTLQMRADPGRPITIAFPDEFEEPHDAPFHFLDGHYKDTFKKGFAEARAWNLSKSKFAVVDGQYRFQTSWEDIPTERNCLSCYSLSLPVFAVATEIRFRDPYSDREYSKNVIRDDQRNRFVAYLECRSSFGSFAFLLEVRFKHDRDNFRRAPYTDAHTTRYYVAQTNPYDSLLPIQHQQVVRQFLSSQTGVEQDQRPSNMSLRNLEGLPSNDPQLRRMVYEIYPKLLKEISQARIAARQERLNIQSIRTRFPILGGASDNSITTFILASPDGTTDAHAAKEIIRPHTAYTLGTIDRYTRKK
jgi:hypothetical protein